MVSPPHEAMHRIFQHDPGLFSRVSRFLGVDIPTPVKATALPTDLTETNPVERRVDTLLRFETAEQGQFLLAIEAQGRKHPDKPASWAYCTAYLWSKYRLPTALLVVCQDHTIEFTAQGLGKNPAKHLWRNLVAVDLSFYKSYLAEEVREEVRKEVRKEVREEVQREVREEARVKDRAEDILFVLEQRGLDVSDDVRSRITDCTDPDLLRHWLARAVTVPKAEEIFEGQ
ncbi:hypothetical protein [Streptomyces sp. SAI-229]|uniref:hypothetical protein n=1 Tax=Streptomyces sp. SAI-229 TaxID=3377731 RepID=UPI003C7D21CE